MTEQPMRDIDIVTSARSMNHEVIEKGVHSKIKDNLIFVQDNEGRLFLEGINVQKNKDAADPLLGGGGGGGGGGGAVPLGDGSYENPYDLVHQQHRDNLEHDLCNKANVEEGVVLEEKAERRRSSRTDLLDELNKFKRKVDEEEQKPSSTPKRVRVADVEELRSELPKKRLVPVGEEGRVRKKLAKPKMAEQVRVAADEQRVRDEEAATRQRLADEQRVRDEEDGIEAERLVEDARQARVAVRQERIRLKAEKEKREAQVLARLAQVEKERVETEARQTRVAARQERIRVKAEEARQEQIRVKAEEARQEQIRVKAEEARQEQIRVKAEEARQEQIRVKAEEARQERIRLKAEEVARVAAQEKADREEAQELALFTAQKVARDAELNAIRAQGVVKKQIGKARQEAARQEEELLELQKEVAGLLAAEAAIKAQQDKAKIRSPLAARQDNGQGPKSPPQSPSKRKPLGAAASTSPAKSPKTRHGDIRPDTGDEENTPPPVRSAGSAARGLPFDDENPAAVVQEMDDD